MNKLLHLAVITCVSCCSCHGVRQCVGIENGSYKGYGIVYFYKPISGNTYELIFAPTCDSAIDKEILEHFDSKRQLEGIGFDLEAEDSLFKALYNKALKIEVDSTRADKQFDRIFICRIFIEFNRVEDNSASVFTRRILIPGSHFTIKYFFTNNLPIKSIKILGGE